MANMFSNKSKKQVPKTFGECIAPDATVSELHSWAESLENWGKTLFKLIIVYGIYSTIRILFTNSSDDEATLILALISSIITWSFYAFVEYIAYHVLALLVSALAYITHNSLISANIALYEASKNIDPSEKNMEEPEKTFDVKTSVRTSNSANSAKPVQFTPAPDGMWLCKNCGTHNKNEYGQCKKCGKFRAR